MGCTQGGHGYKVCRPVEISNYSPYVAQRAAAYRRQSTSAHQSCLPSPFCLGTSELPTIAILPRHIRAAYHRHSASAHQSCLPSPFCLGTSELPTTAILPRHIRAAYHRHSASAYQSCLLSPFFLGTSAPLVAKYDRTNSVAERPRKSRARLITTEHCPFIDSPPTLYQR